jgi:hypothetical protein
MQWPYGDCCMPISRRTGSVFINDRVSAIIEISAACFSRIAPLAQLDRASGYEPEGREFESLRAHHLSRVSSDNLKGIPFLVLLVCYPKGTRRGLICAEFPKTPQS